MLFNLASSSFNNIYALPMILKFIALWQVLFDVLERKSPDTSNNPILFTKKIGELRLLSFTID